MCLCTVLIFKKWGIFIKYIEENVLRGGKEMDSSKTELGAIKMCQRHTDTYNFSLSSCSSGSKPISSEPESHLPNSRAPEISPTVLIVPEIIQLSSHSGESCKHNMSF